MLTENAVEELNFIIEAEFDTTDRSVKNVYSKMKIDGIDRTIGANRYPDYLVPFKQLMERELKQTKLNDEYNN